MENPQLEMEQKGREILAYLRAVLKRNNLPEQKFAIFGQGRTGSELLLSLIDCHPEIHCEGEMLNKKVWFPYLYLQGRMAKYPNFVYGCKVRTDQLLFDQGIDPVKFTIGLQENGWKIVYISRQNLLRQNISLLIGLARQKWHDTADKPFSDRKIQIDSQELIKYLKLSDLYLEKEREIIGNLPHVNVTYEQDLFNSDRHQPTLDRVFDYLGLSSVPVKTKYVKTSANKKLSDSIENYAEIAAALEKTKYAQFLEA